jgi:hypothetical protein
MNSRSIGLLLSLAGSVFVWSCSSDVADSRPARGGAAGTGGSAASGGDNTGGGNTGGAGGAVSGGAGGNTAGTGGSTGGAGGATSGAGGTGGVIAGTGGGSGAGGSTGGMGGTSGTSGTGGTGGAGGSAGGGTGGVIPPPPDGQPAPLPDLGPNVFIFDSSNAGTLQSKADSIYAQQEKDGGGTNRYAFLLKPGTYSATIELGFYEQLLGLGETPDATTITGIHVDAQWFQGGNATWNFWRSVENVAMSSNSMWAVSQGTSMRHVHVKGNLNLADSGWSSGGYLADSLVDGTVSSGSQQQWFSRNDAWGKWQGGNWNMTYVGCTNTPGTDWPYTVVDKTPAFQEKPYLYLDQSGNAFVNVPTTRTDSQGTSWANGPTPGVAYPLSTFYIAKPTDTAQTINAALGQGNNLFFTPGIYKMETSITVTRPGTVVMGIGMPSIVVTTNAPAMIISDVDSVKVMGVIFDTNPAGSPSLLQVGEAGSSKDHSAGPTYLYDVLCRVGGGFAGTAQACITINSNNAIIDHTWMWRADHYNGVGWNNNKGANGLVVNGNDVTAYGLFAEHFQEYQILWNGNGGRTYFFQCECPYDAPGSWGHDGIGGYAGYKVAASVTTHEAWGLGVYGTFSPPVSQSAFEAPTGAGIVFHHMFAQYMGGGGFTHVLNNDGPGCTSGNTKLF